MYEERVDGVEPFSFQHGLATAEGSFLPGDYKDSPAHPPTRIQAPIPAFVGRHELRSPSINNRALWNPFSHYRRVSERYHSSWYDISEPFNWRSDDLYGAWSWYYNVPSCQPCFAFGLFGSPEKPFNGQPELYEIDSKGDLFIPPPVDLPDLMQRAFESALPKLRAKTSLVNSLLELRDFKSLPRSVSHIRDTVARFYRDHSPNGGFQAKYGKLSLRELSRRAADIHLQYAFNIKPLLNDINGVINSIKSYRKQAEKLVSDSEKVHRHHFQVMIGSDVASTTEYSPWIPVELAVGNGIRQFWSRTGRFIELRPSKFHVEIQYSFYYTDFQRRHASALSLLDDLGINFNPQIIWNAIPWSFVVDWVANVGSWLGRYRMNMMEPIVVIERALWSITRTREGSTFIDAGKSRGLPCSHAWETAYRRAPWSYDSNSCITSGLSLAEFALGASLALSRRRSHHSRLR